MLAIILDLGYADTQASDSGQAEEMLPLLLQNFRDCLKIMVER